MKTDGTPLHGSYFDLAAAKHPDLKSAASGQRHKRRLMKPRRGRLGVLPVVLSGALVGVGWLVVALKPEENVRLAVEARDLPAPEPARQEIALAEGAGPVAPGPVALPEAELPGVPLSAAGEAPRRVPEPPRAAATSSREKTIPQSARPRTRAGRPTAAATRPEEKVRLPASKETTAAAPSSGRRPAATLVNRGTDALRPERSPAEPPAIVPARKIFAPFPEYPDAARQAGEEGTVVVEADIDATGTVTGARVARGRSPLLDAAAVAALETWRFEPARRGAEEIASTYRIGIKFTLREDDETEPPGPFEVGGDVEPPRRLEAPLPAYPDAAWANGITGDVLVRAVIDENGAVADIEVVKGLPHGMTEAAVEAIRRWKFAPATRRGQPVAVYRNLSVRFEG